MKKYAPLTLLSIALMLLVYFGIKSTDIEQKATPKLAYNFVKCTPAKFLLEGIDTTKQISPLFTNLGNLHFKINSTNKRVQAFFDQGLKLSYAFNHAEGHRSFMEAARLDPTTAMAYWGQAFALGPNINDPQPDDERKNKINEAMTKARSLASKSSAKEQALIEALSTRYSEDLTKDVAELNMDYMNAMAKVVKKYPEDANIQILYASAVMNTVPWNYWDKDGKPSPNIKEAKIALEKAMQIAPENPGGHHYYIHMVELPYPDLGVPSADKLVTLMPGAGHIVHMPSHIYIRVGRYKDAVEVNQAAILADEDYISQCFAQGLYPLAYYPHNIHFLWSSASLLGDSDIAIDAAKKTAEKVPTGELAQLTFLQDFASTPLLAYVRFGKWNEILTVPAPNAAIKHLNLMRHYARGMAFIRKGNAKEAKEELDAIATLKADPDLENLVATANNTSYTIALVAYEVVAGELAALKGDLPTAIAHLEKAVINEDKLIYTEPAAWHIPTRQNLGAVLLQAKKYKEAEKVYQKDLSILRQNGWSLMGLYNAYMAQNKTGEAEKIMQEFKIAWEDADIKIDKSVL
jgi:tetratricopeptide (TPR) repeat protein